MDEELEMLQLRARAKAKAAQATEPVDPNSWLNAGKATVEGLERGMTGGISDYVHGQLLPKILPKGMVDSAEDIAARKAANPIKAGVAQATGTMGTLAATGGVGGALPEGAGILAKIAAGAGEGGLFGAGNEVSDAGLSDGKINPERALDHIKTGAEFGGAATGVMQGLNASGASSYLAQKGGAAIKAALKPLTGLTPTAAETLATNPDEVAQLRELLKNQDYLPIQDKARAAVAKSMDVMKTEGLQNAETAKTLLAGKQVPIGLEHLKVLADAGDKQAQTLYQQALAHAEANRPFGPTNMGGGTDSVQAAHTQAPLDLHNADTLQNGVVDTHPDQQSLGLGDLMKEVAQDKSRVLSTKTPTINPDLAGNWFGATGKLPEEGTPAMINRTRMFTPLEQEGMEQLPLGDSPVTAEPRTFQKGAYAGLQDQNFDASGQPIATKDFNSQQIQNSLPLEMADPNEFPVDGAEAYKLRQSAGNLAFNAKRNPITGRPEANEADLGSAWRHLKSKISGMTEDDVGNITQNLADDTSSGINLQKGIKNNQNNAISAISTKSPDKIANLKRIADDYGVSDLSDLQKQYQTAVESDKPYLQDASVTKPWTLITPAIKASARKALPWAEALKNSDPSSGPSLDDILRNPWANLSSSKGNQ